MAPLSYKSMDSLFLGLSWNIAGSRTSSWSNMWFNIFYVTKATVMEDGGAVSWPVAFLRILLPAYRGWINSVSIMGSNPLIGRLWIWTSLWGAANVATGHFYFLWHTRLFLNNINLLECIIVPDWGGIVRVCSRNCIAYNLQYFYKWTDSTRLLTDWLLIRYEFLGEA